MNYEFFHTSYFLLHPCLLVVGLGGLEPPTSRLSVVCSSQLSYRPLFGFDFTRLAALAASSARQRSFRYASSPHPCRLASHANPNPHSLWSAFYANHWAVSHR